MAAAVLTPRVRLMTVCDRVRESTTERGVYHLRGVRHTMIARAFPFAAFRLWMFAVLSSSRRGTYPGYVRVLDDVNDKAIFFAHLAPDPHFETDHESLAIVARLRCVFPRAGRYTVQLWFYQAQGNDVLKGEIPFVLVAEEH